MVILGAPVGPDGFIERHDLEPIRREVERLGQPLARIHHTYVAMSITTRASTQKTTYLM